MGVDPNRRGCTERTGGNEIDNQDISNEKKYCQWKLQKTNIKVFKIY